MPSSCLAFLRASWPHQARSSFPPILPPQTSSTPSTLKPCFTLSSWHLKRVREHPGRLTVLTTESPWGPSTVVPLKASNPPVNTCLFLVTLCGLYSLPSLSRAFQADQDRGQGTRFTNWLRHATCFVVTWVEPPMSSGWNHPMMVLSPS